MEITPRSKLFDVLNEYPALEETIIAIALPFKNLRNPVLRRTVGQLATLEQVAKIGGMDPERLVNTLRRAAGQAELQPAAAPPVSLPQAREAGDPQWTAGEAQFVVDSVRLLNQGEVPLLRVNELLPQLETGRFLLLVSEFEPLPILEAMTKQGRQVFHKPHPAQPGLHLTYIGSEIRP